MNVGPGRALLASVASRSPLLACVLLVAALVTSCAPSVDRTARFDVVETSIPEMQQALAEGRVTSRELVEAYLVRIATYEEVVNATIDVNPRALEIADSLDRERAAGRVRGPLHGIPVALKDIIHTTDMPTTGGALAFEGLHASLRGHPHQEPGGRGSHHPGQDGPDRAGQLRGLGDARELQRPGRLRPEPLRPPTGPPGRAG